MKRKALRVTALSIGLLLLSALFAYGICLLIQQKNIAETGNVLGVEWYDPAKTEFEITTKKELYELAELSDFYSFENQTIKLGADIVVNEGNAEDWRHEAPKERWVPISEFKGVFDGQGHTISGLYGTSVESPLGLFIYTNRSCKIQNTNLVNSYFHAMGYGGAGSFSGIGDGEFSKLYSDVIIDGSDGKVGGIIGPVKSFAKLNECWYDGEIYVNGYSNGGLLSEVKGGRVTIQHCLFSGTLESEYSFNASRVGGIVGEVANSAGLTISDTLVSGTVTTKNAGYSGSVIGVVYGGGSVTLSDVYDGAVSNQEFSVASGSTNGGPIRLDNKLLLGVKAYQWTSLNFDEYWVAVDSGAPELKCFTQEGLDLAGVEKEADMSWYSSKDVIFTITNVKQLYGFTMLAQTTDFSGKVIQLGADIVLNTGDAAKWKSGQSAVPALSWTPIGNQSKPFAGRFTGLNGDVIHSISGVYINTDKSYTGLFGFIAPGGVVDNLKLENSYIMSSNNRVGGLTGVLQGSVRNVYIEDDVYIHGTNSVGGLAGMFSGAAKEAEVSNCWVAGHVYNTTNITGGFFGVVYTGNKTVSDCLFTGTVTSDAETTPNVGGLAGYVFTDANKSKFTIQNFVMNGTLSVLDKKTPVGATIGAVAAEVELTTKSVYVTDSRQGSIGGKVSVLGQQMYVLSEELKGNNAYIYTDLDFNKSKNENKKWVATSAGPELALFSKQNGIYNLSGKKVDMTWYFNNYDGKTERSYEIHSLDDFNAFARVAQRGGNFKAYTVRLKTDIYLNGKGSSEWVPQVDADGKLTNAPSNKWTPLGIDTRQFSGTFTGVDGNVIHSISGIYVDNTAAAAGVASGLFGWMSADSAVDGLQIKNSYIESGTSRVGSVAGITYGNVLNVYVDESVTVKGKDTVGGLVGNLAGDSQRTISNCWVAGKIYITSAYAGGIVGLVHKGDKTISDCIFTGTIKSSSNYIGGLVGYTFEGSELTLQDCVVSGSLSGSNVGAALARSDGKKVTIKSVYVTDERIGSLGATVTELGRQIYLASEKLKGNNAYIYTDLALCESANDNKKWVATASGPELSLFSTQNGVYDLSGKKVDVTWYFNNYDGKSGKNYKIKNQDDFDSFVNVIACGGNFKGYTVQLATDIYLNGKGSDEWIPQVNGDGTLANVPSNKWTPLGSDANRFKGTFTGLEKDVIHSIHGVYVDSNITGAGLFGMVDTEGSVEYLKIENSYITSTTNQVGAIAGRLYGSAHDIYVGENVHVKGVNSIGGITGNFAASDAKTISNCWVAGKIYNTSTFTGGIAGIIISGDKTVSNCLFTGSIQSTSSHIGGIVGYAASATKLTFQNCVILGSITGGSTVDAVVAQSAAVGTLTMTNVYSDKTVASSAVNATTKKGKVAFVSAAELAGDGAYLHTQLPLRESEDSNDAWVATQKGPQLAVFATETPDYKWQGQRVDTSWYYNKWTNTTPNTYKIDSLADFYGFSRVVANGVAFNKDTVQLTTDIYLNGKGDNEWIPSVDKNGTLTNVPANQWTPIGNASKQFAGTLTGLDGDVIHSIHGVYVNGNVNQLGLFGVVATIGTVENLKIENSYIASTGNQVGTVVGLLYGDVKNVYVGTNVYVKAVSSVGGIAGQVSGPDAREISNCWVAGKIYQSGVQSGGIAGLVTTPAISNSKTISNCLFSGTLTSTATGASGVVQKIGGLAGWAYYTTLNLQNCLVTGQFKDATNSNRGVGSAVGWGSNYVQGATSVYATCEWKGVENPGVSGVLKTTGQVAGTAAFTNMTGFPLRQAATGTEAWVATEAGPQLAIFATATPCYPEN